MPNIDLHIHSNCSDDGEFSVQEIMQLCKQSQIEYLSITDHNTVRGVPRAIALAAQTGVQVVAGVELDCVHEGRNFHLLGYDFDYTHLAFVEIEQSIFAQERNAAQEKIERIKQETGIPLCIKEVLAGNGVVTGEMIAEVLLKREDAKQHKALLPYLPGGSRDDNPYVNFYWDYFSQGKPAYVPIKYISLSEGIALLRALGGISVLAHPGQNLRGDYAFLHQLVEAGIDGVEVYSSYHSEADIAYFGAAAQQNRLIATCGSDFHGKNKPSIPLCGHGAGENMSAIAATLQKAGVLNECKL